MAVVLPASRRDKSSFFSDRVAIRLPFRMDDASSTSGKKKLKDDPVVVVWYVAVVLENGFRIRWRSIPIASGCDRRCVKLARAGLRTCAACGGRRPFCLELAFVSRLSSFRSAAGRTGPIRRHSSEKHSYDSWPWN